MQFSAKTARMAFAALLLFGNADWVTDSAASPASLAALVKKADDAYRNLPGSMATSTSGMPPWPVSVIARTRSAGKLESAPSNESVMPV